jgi:hypothetical protein
MHVMKVKWVIFVALNDDGSVKKVKARILGCGCASAVMPIQSWEVCLWGQQQST